MMEHIPVLLKEVLEMIAEEAKPIQSYIDGTFGRGGHARAIMEAHPGVKVVGLDRDHEAIEFGQNNFSKELETGQLKLIRTNYVDVADHIEEISTFFDSPGADAILLDLGVSSPQLDRGDRGFSFYHDGPLDMRMDHNEELTAAEIVNTWQPEELSDLFYQLGEIRRPNRVVAKIIERRREKSFETTAELSTLIEQCEGWRKKGHHPATNYFLALRLKVNSELEQVEEMLEPMVSSLNPGGRLLVITFHSTEDRIVKIGLKALKEKGLGELVNKKVIQAKWEEKKKNQRARNTKLRVFQKKGEPC